MTNPILNLDDAPEDPIERLLWLGGVATQVERELEPEWRTSYFNARLTGRIMAAKQLHLHSRKRIMAWTRAENERRGRQVRWNDDL